MDGRNLKLTEMVKIMVKKKVWVALYDDGDEILVVGASFSKQRLLAEKTIDGTIRRLIEAGDVTLKSVELTE